MKSEINNIFNHTSCLTKHEIEQYVSGTLNEKETRRVELHLADCPMCSDELDGYMLLKDKNKLHDIVSDINKKIDEKISGTKVIPIAQVRKKLRKRVLSIAASIVLLIGAGYVIKFYLNTADNNVAEVTKEEKASGENALLEKSESEEIISGERENKSLKQNTEKSKTETVANVLVSGDKKEYKEEQNEIEREDYGEQTFPAVESNDKDVIAVDEDKKGNNIDIDETVTDDIIDNIESEKSDNSNRLITGAEKNADVKSKSEQPNEEIAFMTTRGVAEKDRKKIEKKESEKYIGLRQSALLSYKMRVWDEALNDFNKYLSYKPNDFEIVYKSGIAYYNLTKYDKAVSRFDKVIKEGINPYVDDAEWHAAQSLVKLGKNNEAKVILNKIIVKNGKYQNKALDLLNSLN